MSEFKRRAEYWRRRYDNRAYEIVNAAVHELCSNCYDDLYQLREEISRELVKPDRPCDRDVLDTYEELRRDLDPRLTFWEQIAAIGEEVS